MGTLACDLGCFPLDNGAYPPLSHSPGPLQGIRGLVEFGKLTPPSSSSALPPCNCLKAAPKCISGRTSYLRVRLAFHPYPQLIPAFCTRHGFGPPLRFIGASTWPWVAHPVSGLIQTTRHACWRLGRPRCPVTRRPPPEGWTLGSGTRSTDSPPRDSRPVRTRFRYGSGTYVP